VSFFSGLGIVVRNLAPALDVSHELATAIATARQVLADGGSIRAALKAGVRETGTMVDDQVLDVALAELQAGIARGLVALEWIGHVGLTIAEALADPRVQRAIQQVITIAIETGYRAGGVGAKVRVFREERLG
jgi:hypothetical protein